MSPERSIYAYDPVVPPEREVQKRVADLIEKQRGTSRQVRFAETYILTCACGALTVTRDMSAPAKFTAEHAGCGDAA